jgi:hypothetical protein
MAIAPSRKCRTPLAANPARASNSNVCELVTSSAAFAACLNSLLMVLPLAGAGEAQLRAPRTNPIVPRNPGPEQSRLPPADLTRGQQWYSRPGLRIHDE